MSTNNHLQQGAAWFQPSVEFEAVHQRILKQKPDEVSEQNRQLIQKTLSPEHYPLDYIEDDLSRDKLNRIRSCMEQGGVNATVFDEKINNQNFWYQYEIIQTLRAVQKIFTLGVAKGKISEDQTTQKGIALNDIDESLAKNLKLGWALAKESGEDSYIGLKNEDNGDSVSIALKDLRPPDEQGKDMLQALTNTSKSNFLLRQVLKKNLNDTNDNQFKMDHSGAIYFNGEVQYRAIAESSAHLVADIDDDKFNTEPPENFFY